MRKDTDSIFKVIVLISSLRQGIPPLETILVGLKANTKLPKLQMLQCIDMKNVIDLIN